MATSKSAPAMSAKELNEKLNAEHLGVEQIPMSNKDRFDAFKNVDSSELEEQTSEYFKFNIPGTFHFIAQGIVPYINDQGKTVDAVMMKDENEKMLINANAVLVNSVKKITSLPCYIRVEYLGEVKGTAGSYKNMKILSFPNGA